MLKKFLYLFFFFRLFFRFLGMKVYVIDEKELIMELFLKWVGNFNVLVVVKVFGLRVIV